MSNLRKSLVISVIAVGSALLFSGWAQAVDIIYYASGFHAQAAASVSHDGVLYDAGTRVDAGQPTVDINVTADAGNSTPQSNSTNAVGWGQAQYYIEYGNALLMSMEASAHGLPQSPADSGSAYGNANTVAPGYTNGIFFQLAPTVGCNEDDGDPVIVTFQWFYTYAVTGGGKAQLTGGYDDNLAITVGYDPANPYPGGYLSKAVWTHEKVVIDHDVTLTDGTFDDTFFRAQIGDIIGIFLGVSAEMSFEGTYNTTNTLCFSNLQMYANTPSDPPAVPLPGAVWLLGSGLLGLVGLRRFKKS